MYLKNTRRKRGILSLDLKLMPKTSEKSAFSSLVFAIIIKTSEVAQFPILWYQKYVFLPTLFTMGKKWAKRIIHILLISILFKNS
jgi:hypothetical protein